MSREIEFLKGGGKTFEIARTLANWVLAEGGEEQHILRILKPNDPAASQIARLLVKSATVAERPPREIVMDKEAGYYTRMRVLRDASDIDLALSLLKDSDESDSNLMLEAIKLIALKAGERREAMLFEIALMFRERSAGNAVIYLEKTSQDYLLKIASAAHYQETRVLAVKKLDQVHLKAASTIEDIRVKCVVADLIFDPQILQQLDETDPDKSVHYSAHARRSALGLI